MASYSGMTYAQIIERAMLFAKKNNIELTYAECQGLIDEAMLEVTLDVHEDDNEVSISWPSTTATISTQGLRIEKAFGDATELVWIDRASYREMFLGTESSKPAGDRNFYYTTYGDTLTVEPDLTGFTNLIMMAVPNNEAYTKATEGNEPSIHDEYRLLVSYKICELGCPASVSNFFEREYRKLLKKRMRSKNRQNARGWAHFWDPFPKSNVIKQSGWPGKLSTGNG